MQITVNYEANFSSLSCGTFIPLTVDLKQENEMKLDMKARDAEALLN